MRCIPVFLAFAVFVSCRPDYSANEILEKSLHAIERQNAVSYYFESRDKYFDNRDTTTMRGKVSLIRVPTDTILGCHIQIESEQQLGDKTYRFEHFYDGIQTIVVSHNDQTVTIDHPDSNGIGVSDGGFITGNIVGRAICSVLTNSKFYDTDSAFEMSVAGISDVNNEQCYELVFKEAGSGDYSDFVKTYFVSTTSFLPVKQTFSVRFVPENKFQYNELNIWYDESVMDTRPEVPISIDYPEHYDVAYFLASDYEARSLLSTGAVPEDIELPMLHGAETFHLSDFYGKVVLIDFWYLSCAPCKKAIPNMVDLQDKYGNHGLVILGINPFDHERNRIELNSFYEAYGIGYRNLSDSAKLAVKAFNIRTYPTQYVLNRKGEVVFGYEGFNEALTDSLDSVIRNLMNI